MSAVCPQGHQSSTDDFCDVCGEPIAAAAASAQSQPDPATPAVASSSSLSLDPPTAAPPQECPNCGGTNPADAAFCEACGYDFTTGELPSAVAPMADPGADWVAEVWIDPDWFAFQDSPGGCATSGAPTVVPLRVTKAIVGRPSKSRKLIPEIDCGNDGAVSHRHAQITLEHDRWYVEDLGSTNGTFVGAPGEALPAVPLEPQQRRELDDDERIYLGAWTRVVVRRATDDEKSSLASN
jgi:hypothetical protein